MHPHAQLTNLLSICRLAIWGHTANGIGAPLCSVLLRFVHVSCIPRTCSFVPLYEYTTFCLPIHQLVDTHVSVFAMMTNVNICKHVLCGHMFSFFLGRFLGVELLGHMVSLCLLSKRLPTVLQNGCTISRVLVSSCPHQHLVWSVLLLMAILVGVRWRPIWF